MGGKKYIFGKKTFTNIYNVTNAYSLEELASGIVVDKIGGKNGTTVGTINYSQTGKVGKCFGFNSSSVYMDSFNLGYGFSVKMWVYLDTISLQKVWIAGGLNGNATTNYSGIAILQSNDKILIRFGSGLSSSSAGRRDYTTNSSCLSIGWNCVHVNFLSFGVADIYVNGVVYANTYTSGTASSANLTNVSYRLFRDATGASYYTGLMDELYFWNSIVTPTNILQIYNTENAGISII